MKAGRAMGSIWRGSGKVWEEERRSYYGQER